MLTFDRVNRKVLRADGSVLCACYSGFDPDPSVKGEAGEGVDNPEMDAVRNVGPIPAGFWVMGKPFTHPTTGEFTIRLQPVPGTDTHGRSGFLWHGDSRRAPGAASHGCMVSARPDRERAVDEGDYLIHVV